MKTNGRTVLVCDCARSMPLDGAALGVGEVHHQLCRTQRGRVESALRTGGPLLVACTQEAPLFTELAAELAPGADLAFANIRERAGWSDEADQAGPKIAALLAEAGLDASPHGTVVMRSEGSCLVYGTDERAIEAARTLAGRLDVTVLLKDPADILPPRVRDVPLFKGRLRSARGWLGTFEIVVDDYAPALPDSRAALLFEPARMGAQARCDIILDLTGGVPLFPAHEKRDGYLRPDPGNPAAVAKALFEAAELVGEFEKPRYVDYKPDLCAHARSRKTGCTRCLEVCPTGAITPDLDHVAIDPHVCAGCGSCAAVCPTGAAGYALPSAQTLHERLRTLLSTYLEAGGAEPVLLVHDRRHGDEVISLMARFGRGLPARVLPFAVNEVGQVGLDVFAAALAYGATQVRVLTGGPGAAGGTAALAGQIGLIETAMAGLGYGSGRVSILDARDPDAVEAELWSLPRPAGPLPGLFLPMGGKRAVTLLALRHLHKVAPLPLDVLPLAAGAPFGRVAVEVSGCTLCLACVGACPTGALQDSPDKPRLAFAQDACVQCGLCRNTCPEAVISLVPEIDFRDGARGTRTIKEEEPFCCTACGKPFATQSSIRRIEAVLAGRHSMFTTPEAVNRLRMCDDCRVRDQFAHGANPFAGAGRPAPRTTDDFLRDREAAAIRHPEMENGDD